MGIHFLRNPLNSPFFEIDYWKNVKKLESSLRIINEYYLDSENVTYDELADTAIRAMTYKLDRYSEYVVPEEFNEFAKENYGVYNGIGIEIKKMGDVAIIKEVVPDSPADQAGLKLEDTITHINSKKISELNESQLVAMIRGEVNSALDLNVERQSPLENKKEFLVEIKKKEVWVESILSSTYESGSIGYLKISQFTSTTPNHFRQKYEDLVRNYSPKGIIVDLRDNPGGLLQQAIELADLFFPPKETILVLQSRIPSENTAIESSDKTLKSTLPMVILINGNTSSSAELLAGVLRLKIGAQLVGEKSFGKASIQNIFQLNRSTALKLTAARYLLADGLNINGVGLEPDYEVTNFVKREGETEISRMVKSYQEIPENNPNKDFQLLKAIELMK